MLIGIDIQDGQKDLPAVFLSLREILNAFEKEFEGWHWALTYLWAVGSLPGPRNILELEDAVNNSSVGFPVSWDEIECMADNLEQVIDAVFVANHESKTVERKDDDINLYMSNDLVVEAFDSSYWRVVVHSRDVSLIFKLESVFKNTERVSFSEK